RGHTTVRTRPATSPNRGQALLSCRRRRGGTRSHIAACRVLWRTIEPGSKTHQSDRRRLYNRDRRGTRAIERGGDECGECRRGINTSSASLSGGMEGDRAHGTRCALPMLVIIYLYQDPQ